MKIILSSFLLFVLVPAMSQTDNWDNYVLSVNDKPVSIVVNLGLKDLAPVKERPFAIVLRIKYPEMDNRGFPVESLADELNQLESELETIFQKKNGAWYAGRFTQRGLREFYFYALDTVGYVQSSVSILQKHSKFPFLVKAVYDKEWTNYFEVLYPHNEEKEKMENRKIIDELQRKGDHSGQSRPIDHTLYFKSDWFRKSFLKELDLPDFKVTEMPVEKTETGNYPFRLVISRPDKPEIQHMNDLTIGLSKLAQKNSGKYDSWSTYVVRK
jgi:uncharacterized protein (TIGR01619 family)